MRAEQQNSTALTTRRDFLETVGASVGAAMLTPARSRQALDYPQLATLRAAHQAQGVILPNKTYRTME